VSGPSSNDGPENGGVGAAERPWAAVTQGPGDQRRRITHTDPLTADLLWE
jgi:hypothetical protein